MRRLSPKFIRLIRLVLSLAIFWVSLVRFPTLIDIRVIWLAGIWSAIMLFHFFILRSNTGRGKQLNRVILLKFTLFLLGYSVLLAGLSSVAVKLFVGLAAAAVFYLYSQSLEKGKPDFADRVFTLVTALYLGTVLWAVQFFFALPWWWFLLAVFIVFTLIFWSNFQGFEKIRRQSLLYALIGSLIIVQVSWAVLFWPVHFFTASIMSFAVFYVIYILSRAHFRKVLDREKLLFHSGLIVLLVLAALLSSPWLPS